MKEGAKLSGPHHPEKVGSGTQGKIAEKRATLMAEMAAQEKNQAKPEQFVIHNDNEASNSSPVGPAGVPEMMD